MKKLIYFPERREYNEFVFEANCTYSLDEDFANRWIRRGCSEVEKADKVSVDPRFLDEDVNTIPEKNPAKKPVKKARKKRVKKTKPAEE